VFKRFWYIIGKRNNYYRIKILILSASERELVLVQVQSAALQKKTLSEISQRVFFYLKMHIKGNFALFYFFVNVSAYLMIKIIAITSTAAKNI